MRTFVAQRSALLAISLLCSAAHAQDDTLTRTVSVEIAAQPLAPALLAFSRQAEVQIIAPALVVEPHATRGARGRMPLGDALHRILAGSPLRFRLVGVNTIGIDAPQERPQAPAEDVTEYGSVVRALWAQIVRWFEQLALPATEAP